MKLEIKTVKNKRHSTKYIIAGDVNGPLIIFIHGWPELGISWRQQMKYFAGKGWRCIAPDMRGYGGSTVPGDTKAYSMEEITMDMVELHDSLGGDPAIWVGHDWGSPVVWSLATHYPERCGAVANLCVPYLPGGLHLESVLPLVDRGLYPEEEFPLGQWDYFKHYEENFDQATADVEADVPSTIAALYQKGTPDMLDRPAITANVRKNGGWFGEAHRAPAVLRDEDLMSQEDYDHLVRAFEKTGFRGANSWYMNSSENAEFACKAVNNGILTLPVLFIHACYDTVCDSVHSRLAVPMQQHCKQLTEAVVHGGHELQLDKPKEVNGHLHHWLEGLKNIK